ncbi:MAG: molybdenum cofactor biosynthesis protein D/E [Candidatus Binatia bacterium]|nr:MAG: molybdenum cofactor biosynthesis protein D/E [Candidatus Binatia bacterium]
MKVRVRYFASVRECLGRREDVLEVPEGATLGELWQLLLERSPELSRLGCSLSFALNQEYADPAAVLREGDEVALIPPVSGGAPSSCEIVETPIDVEALVRAVSAPSAGATVVFVGTTRVTNEGRRVRRLEYEAFGEMALREMEKIAVAVRERWPVQRVSIVHRVGVVPVGEPSVVVAVSAAHRAEAFEACRFAIDRLKETVPIWKKEFFEGGELWIGPQSGKPGPTGGG